MVSIFFWGGDLQTMCDFIKFSHFRIGVWFLTLQDSYTKFKNEILTFKCDSKALKVTQKP